MKLELKHLAPYLPYKLQVYYNSGIVDVFSIDNDCGLNMEYNIYYDHCDCDESCRCNLKGIRLYECKPILRPISSITEEEALELLGCAISETKEYPYKGSFNIIKEDNGIVAKSKCCSSEYSLFVDNGTLCIEESFSDCSFNCHYPNIEGYEWLFKNHFDVFGLIDKGLAVDKTELK